MFEESIIGQKNTASPLATITGESYQPARIYYQVGQKNAVLGRLKRLRCIDYDPTQNRWAWLYTQEAKNIEFENSYGDIPKQYRPIVLGYFSFEDDKILRLDVRSFERAIKAISFFDSKINRNLAKVTKIRIVNKLFPATLTTEEMSNHHTIFFEQTEIAKPKLDLEKLEEIASQYEEEERKEATMAYVNQQMKKTLPDVEELEAHIYEDGIESLVMPLRMRQIEAMEHWKGNKNFSQFDIMKTLLEKFDGEDL